MDLFFETVYLFLDWLSEVTGLSYEEVNIVVYFILLPVIYLHLVDRILRRHVLAPLFGLAAITFLTSTRDFAGIADRLFRSSVEFLESFEAIGWNYGTSSVILCVFAPLMLFVALLHFAYPSVIRLATRRRDPDLAAISPNGNNDG